jgi:hypothetical protein
MGAAPAKTAAIATRPNMMTALPRMDGRSASSIALVQAAVAHPSGPSVCTVLCAFLLQRTLVANGTKRHFAAPQRKVAFGSEADIGLNGALRINPNLPRPRAAPLAGGECYFSPIVLVGAPFVVLPSSALS